MNTSENNFRNAMANYFKGVRLEWGKITWPEKPQVVAETIFVVAIVTVFTIAVFLIDISFNGLVSLIMKNF